jgi:acyl carrier protein
MSDIEDIKDRIFQVIIRDLELNISKDKLLSANNLNELFGMDSIAIIELVVGLEKEFDIKIPEEYLSVDIFENISTIAEHILPFAYGKDH